MRSTAALDGSGSQTTPRWLDSDAIRRLLPHRWPFLYLDRVLDVRPGVEATGVKNVAVSEPQFAGHFPERSVLPGVLLVEAMAQLAGVVVATGTPAGNGIGASRAYLASLRNVRFRRLVVPGDQVLLHVSKTHDAHGLVEFRGDARVEGQVVADATLIIAV